MFEVVRCSRLCIKNLGKINKCTTCTTCITKLLNRTDAPLEFCAHNCALRCAERDIFSLSLSITRDFSGASGDSTSLHNLKNEVVHRLCRLEVVQSTSPPLR